MSLKPQIAIILLALFPAAGCSSMIRPESPQPVFYQLEYQPVSLNCPRPFDGGVRVWTFTTAPPYGQNQMVVRAPDREVMFSRNYQWAALPGAMLAERIKSDLEGGGLFSGGVMEAGLGHVSWELSGRIDQFACRRTDKGCKAILAVDVSLENTKSGTKKIFQKEYRFESEPLNREDSSEFAAAMSRIARRFSEQLQRDLCTVAKKR